MQRTYQFSEIGPTQAQQAIVDLLISVGQRQVYAKGALITQCGDAADGFWLIHRGEVTVCRFGPEGTLTVFAVLGAGDVLGDLGCLSGVPRQVDAFAEQDAELIWIDRSTVDTLLETAPQFARWLLASLAAQLRAALDRIDTHQSLSAEGRLMRFLSELHHRDGPDIDMTQQELADFIGVSRVTTGQIIRRLASVGIIQLGYRKIRILDEGRLGTTPKVRGSSNG